MRILMIGEFSNSILLTVKKSIGPSAEYPDFRQELLNWINNTLAVLCDIGVGPKDGFLVTDETQTWADFVEPIPKWSTVITFVCSKAKLNFDPPVNGSSLQALKESVDEDEWRLNFRAEREGC